tara:strand:- start:894 stop:1277 length:384 start_codon:yes stop_codon:yes gene_type:complete
MSIYQYQAGIGNAPSYQVSGAPFVTGSSSLSTVQQISFPKVTKEITVTVRSTTATDTLEIYFNTAASANNKYSLKVGTDLVNTVTFDVKCTELFVSSGNGVDWNVYASLTGIATGSMYTLTGHGITT